MGRMVQNTAAGAEFRDICTRRVEAYTHGTGMLTGKVERREGSYCGRSRMREAQKRARRSGGKTEERRRARAVERNDTGKSERTE